MSVILAPGMTAFGATEKPYLALISGTELAQPPERKIVLTFRALDLYRGHGFNLTLFFHDNDLIFAAHHFFCHLISAFNFSDITAFPALQLTG
jgi:hypothetical protein